MRKLAILLVAAAALTTATVLQAAVVRADVSAAGGAVTDTAHDATPH